MTRPQLLGRRWLNLPLTSSQADLSRGSTPTRTQDERADSRFKDESFRSEARVFAWRSDRVIVGCDIDSTISDTSLAALFFDEIDMSSTPIEGSADGRLKGPFSRVRVCELW